MNGIGPEQVKLFGWLAAGQINPVGIYTYNSGTLSWEPQAPITSGGGGGPVTIADGADVAEGATSDAAVTSDTSGTVSGKLRGLVKWAYERMPVSLGQKAMAASFPVAIASDQSAIPVTGAFFQATQPISAVALPLPAGAATEATLATRASEATLATRVADATITARLGLLGQAAMAASAPVVIASNQSAVPVSGVVSTKTDLTPSAPATATVGVASAAAVAANGARKGLHVRNTSTAGQRISLAFDAPAVLDSGLTLYPQDVFDMDEFDFDLGEVRAIANAAAARLSIQEYAT